jgi:tetratricopeptide (TPR) repeat protein
MSLTGPEIDLLREALSEDPGDPVFRDVAEALAARGDLDDAVGVLAAAVAAGAGDADDARRLAGWAAEVDDRAAFGVAARALGPAAMEADPALARAWALALEHEGQLVRASELARRVLAISPDDAELRAVVERAEASAPDPAARGVDPLYTVARAEAYVDIGRADLGIRVLRRILAHRPDDVAVHARLLQLRAQPADPRPWVDDLSEEYWINRPVGPIVMPAPGLAPATVGEAVAADPFEDAPTAPSAPPRDAAPPHPHFASPILDDDDDDAFQTQIITDREVRAAMPDADEEATVVMSDELIKAALAGGGRPLPGARNARAALGPDTEDDDDPIAQARAIERAAKLRGSPKR